jgi:hypothetical protein
LLLVPAIFSVLSPNRPPHKHRFFYIERWPIRREIEVLLKCARLIPVCVLACCAVAAQAQQADSSLLSLHVPVQSAAHTASVADWLGSERGKNSIQVDLTQPLRIPVINLETHLQLQYFDGYGERLRTYNQKSSVWRLGVAFKR